MASDTHGGTDVTEPLPITWIGSDRRLARHVARPVLRFLQIEAAGGIVMLVAAAVALIWANSPWQDSYHDLLETHLRISLGSTTIIDETLEAWINDALMVVFFFVVGLEIKHELVVGELRDPAAALLPALGALGGMMVPAAVYFAFNAGGEGSAGWGIPMATDIAFAIGVLSLFGSRVSGSIKVFLLTLAIVDDIAAIIVIAIFYTGGLSTGWLLTAALTVVLLVMMRASRVWYTPAYLVVGVFLWYAVFRSGVHATIAGVILGVLAPARPLLIKGTLMDEALGRLGQETSSVPLARRASFEMREHVAVADRLAALLHPWTSFIVVPVFALANAGVALSAGKISDSLTSPVTLGIVAGLVLGKFFGVSSFTWLAVRSGVCELPRGATWRKVMGVAGVAGIGFTVSLFITNLAFTSAEITDQAKVGIIIASVLAAILGAAILGSSPKVSDSALPEGSPQAEQAGKVG